jgi:hypothetical protein
MKSQESPSYSSNDDPPPYPKSEARILGTEDRRILEAELEEVENDIKILRKNLHEKVHYANHLKTQLGYSVLIEVQKDFVHGINAIRVSNTYVKTSEALKVAAQKTSSALEDAKEVVSEKLVDVKKSETYKSVQGAVTSAYTGVMNSLWGGNRISIKDSTVEEGTEALPDHPPKYSSNDPKTS